MLGDKELAVQHWTLCLVQGIPNQLLKSAFGWPLNLGTIAVAVESPINPALLSTVAPIYTHSRYLYIYILFLYDYIYIRMCIIFYYLLLSLSTCILYIYMYTHVHCTCEWCSKRMHFQERPSCRRILSNICWQPWWMIDQGVTTHDYTTLTYNYCNCLVKLEGIHLLARHESRRGLLAFLAEGFHIFLPSKSSICGVVILIHSKFMRGSPLVARASHIIAMPGV